MLPQAVISRPASAKRAVALLKIPRFTNGLLSTRRQFSLFIVTHLKTAHSPTRHLRKAEANPQLFPKVILRIFIKNTIIQSPQRFRGERRLKRIVFWASILRHPREYTFSRFSDER
jgi:hypothetical protein